MLECGEMTSVQPWLFISRYVACAVYASCRLPRTPAKGHEITHSHAEPRISGSCAYTASPLDTCLQQVLVEAAADKSLARGHSGRRGARGLSVRADLL